MNNHDLQDAIKALQLFCNVESLSVPYFTANEAPSTYKSMREYRDKHHMFCIFDGGSEDTILPYRSNIEFRAIHDKMHYDLKLTFTFKDEKKLSNITSLKVFKWLRQRGFTKKVAYNTFKLVNAEIKGQIEYYERKNKFLDNQTEYIKTWLGVA
mgnify:CR=1 FL=1